MPPLFERAAGNADAMDQFGCAVALSADGNTLVVGASQEDGGAVLVNGNAALICAVG